MPKTILQLTPQERSTFHPRAVVERRTASSGDARLRWEEARQLARRAAARLKQDYAASRVVLFGSVTRAVTFTRWSDVDLAVWGVPPERFYSAVAAMTALSADIGIDLVDAEHCGQRLLAAIERDGVAL
jgi:uncharacterized protein